MIRPLIEILDDVYAALESASDTLGKVDDADWEAHDFISLQGAIDDLLERVTTTQDKLKATK